MPICRYRLKSILATDFSYIWDESQILSVSNNKDEIGFRYKTKMLLKKLLIGRIKKSLPLTSELNEDVHACYRNSRRLRIGKNDSSKKNFQGIAK